MGRHRVRRSEAKLHFQGCPQVLFRSSIVFCSGAGIRVECRKFFEGRRRVLDDELIAYAGTALSFPTSVANTYFPVELLHVWEAFVELAALYWVSDHKIVPIRPADIESYCHLSGANLSPYDFRTL